jgi:hypothetical protein
MKMVVKPAQIIQDKGSGCEIPKSNNHSTALKSMIGIRKIGRASFNLSEDTDLRKTLSPEPAGDRNDQYFQQHPQPDGGNFLQNLE